MGAEGSEMVDTGLLLGLGEKNDVRSLVELVTGLGVLGRAGFIHSCASARLRKDLYTFPGYLLT